jgi:hypothetical protein
MGSAIVVSLSHSVVTSSTPVNTGPNFATVLIATPLRPEPVEGRASAKLSAQFSEKQFVELVADYLDGALSAEMRTRFEEHLAGCDGCTAYLSQTRQVMAELQSLSAAPDLNPQIADPEISRRTTNS